MNPNQSAIDLQQATASFNAAIRAANEASAVMRAATDAAKWPADMLNSLKDLRAACEATAWDARRVIQPLE